MKVFPVIALIAGSLLTLTVTIFIDSYRERKKRNQTKKYLLHSIDNLILNSRLTYENIQVFIQQLNENPKDVPVLNTMIGFNSKSIEIVSYEDRFKIFVLKNKNKEKGSENLNNFNNAIELIGNNFPAVIESYTSLLKFERDCKKLSNDHFQQLQEILTTKNERMNAPNTEKTFNEDPMFFPKQLRDKKLMADIIPIYNAYLTEGIKSNKVDSFYLNLVKPVNDIAMKHNDYELVNFLLPVSSNFRSIVLSRNSFIDKIGFYNVNLNQAILFLEDIVKFLD